MLYVLTSLSQCSCTSWGTRNPEIASFHFNAVCCFANKHETYSYYHLVTTEPPFAKQSTVFIKQNLLLLWAITTHSLFTMSVTMSVAKSAVAEGRHYMLCQLKSCQLLHNCTKNAFGKAWWSLEITEIAAV